MVDIQMSMWAVAMVAVGIVAVASLIVMLVGIEEGGSSYFDPGITGMGCLGFVVFVACLFIELVLFALWGWLA